MCDQPNTFAAEELYGTDAIRKTDHNRIQRYQCARALRAVAVKRPPEGREMVRRQVDGEKCAPCKRGIEVPISFTRWGILL